MTVRELIKVLTQIEDQETRVMVRGYEGGYNDIIMVDNTPAIYEMALDINTEWYYGAHERVEDVYVGDLDRYHIIKAILI